MGYEWRFDVVMRWLPYFLGGLQTTILMAVTAMIGGTILGLFLAMVRASRTPGLDKLATVYTEFFRTTPGYSQLLWIYYLVPILSGLRPPPFWAAWFALSLNMAAFLGEIFRAGIESISRGQWEAALAIGMNRTQAYRRIILPQAVLRVVPPMASMWVSLFRDTSLVAMVAVSDLFYRARIAAFRTFRPLEIYTLVALIYIIICLPQARLADRLHHKYRVRE
jgi:polar amino acid transport system permease protein